jgi:toxin-antitoxin system PIN domain toxin
VLLDANLLLYAVDSGSAHHSAAVRWLESILNGERRVAIPWQTIGAFMRIATHPRVYDRPLTAAQAWAHVDGWLGAEPTWIPPATTNTARILGSIIALTPVTANLVPDAQLAALAIEHGLVIQTADADFARFTDARWENPLAR